MKFLYALFLLCAVLTTVQAQWQPIAPYPGKEATGLFSFAIGDKAYVGGGISSKECWEYTPETDTWRRVADLPMVLGAWSFSFVVDGMGYVGGGDPLGDKKPVQYVYEYNPSTNVWTQRADFTWLNRAGGVGFVTDGRPYAGMGYSNLGTYNDLFNYNPVTNQWIVTTRKPEGNVTYPGCFVIDGLAYIATGSLTGGDTDVMFNYDPLANNWQQKASFPGGARHGAASFMAGGKGIVGCGIRGTDTVSMEYRDFWAYDAQSDTWTELPNSQFPGAHTAWCTSFVVNNVAYVGGGSKITTVTTKVGKWGWKKTTTVMYDTTLFFKYSFGSLLETSLSRRALTFNTVLKGETKDTLITVRNGGNRSLSVTDITITGSSSNLLSLIKPSMPQELSPGQSFQITIRYSPPDNGTVNATLQITSNADNGPVYAAPISGNSFQGLPEIAVNQTSLDFGTIDEYVSLDKTVTVSNSGPAPLVISSAAVVNDFSAAYTLPEISLPLIVNSGQSAEIKVRFTPPSGGYFIGKLQLQSNAENGSLKEVALAGNGTDIVRSIQLSAITLLIEGVQVGTTGEGTFEVQSKGPGPLKITEIGIENDTLGQFSLEIPQLPVTIAAGAKLAVKVKFTPVIEGTHVVDVKVISNADNGTQKTNTVTGISFLPPYSEMVLEPDPFQFDTLLVNGTQQKNLLVKSTGTLSLRVSAVTIENNTGNAFSLEPVSLPFNLSAGGSKTLKLNFSPKTAGDFTADLKFTSNVTGSETYVLALRGTAKYPGTSSLSLSVSAFDIGNVVENKFKDSSFTITSSGTAPIIIQQMNVTGTDAGRFTASGITIPETIPAGESRTITVRFSPLAVQPYNATLELTTNGSTPNFSIPLHGTGQTSTGINGAPAIPESSIAMFPNPAAVGSALNYMFTGSAPVIGEIVLYDTFGRVAMRTGQIELQPGVHSVGTIPALPCGLYFVSVVSGARTMIVPLVINE